MKSKIFLSAIMLLSFLLLACSSDDNNSDNSEGGEVVQTTLKLLSTTWVYDKPSEYSWEKTEFKENGVFYTSYYDNSIYQIQEDLNGRFFLDKDGNITGQYKLGAGTLMNLDWSIKSISELELSIKNNIAGLEFTYSKLLDEINLKSGETVTPDYGTLIPNTITAYKNIYNGEIVMPHIKGFTSHNPKVAEVDANTGEIKGLSGGRTYVDIVTTEGTAVVEVNVTGILPYDYCDFLGLGREEIYDMFGKSPYSDTNKQIMYLLSEGDFGYLVFNFSTWTDKVEAVSVVAKEKPSFTNDEMRAYLNSAYYAYEKGTTDTQYAYINAETYDKATAGIIWYPQDRQLVVVSINHDLFKDYSPLLGRTKDEVLSLMDGTPFRITDGYISYGLDDKYLDMVVFYYTLDFINYSSTAQVIIMVVKNEANEYDIINYLNGKYVYMEKESTEANRVYLTADGTLVVEYDLENKQIWYYKNISASKAKVMRSKKVKL